MSNEVNQIVYIGLGSNIEPRLHYLHQAIASLKNLPSVKLLGMSSVYESTAMGFEGPTFYNMVISLSCNNSPHSFLEECQKIERSLGRIQKKKRNDLYDSRTIDIDILEFGNNTLFDDDLLIPHPEINNRPFVQIPLIEIKNTTTPTTILQMETKTENTSKQPIILRMEATNELKRLLKRPVPL